MPELTRQQLSEAVAGLAKDSARNAEVINGNAQMISGEARDIARVADQIGALRVDKATVAETREVSKIMDGLSDAAIAYAVAGQHTSKTAQSADDANHRSHDAIQEAVNRSPVGSEIHDVDRGWLTQE